MIRWSPFHAGPSADNSITVHFYDLLLVMPDTDVHYKEKVATLDSRLMGAHTTFYYHTITNFELNNRLQRSDPFTYKLYRQAVLLHNSSKKPLLCRDTPNSAPAFANADAHNWERSINLAHRSYSAAKRLASDNERCKVLNYLYTAAVQVCRALIRLHTGQRPQEQKLSALLQHCDNFCLIRHRVFPGTTPEEKELLQQLERATMMEFDKEHIVPYHVVQTLLKRIGNMLQQAESLFQLKQGAKVLT